MYPMDSFAEENLMVEWSQMPSTLIMEQLLENNSIKNENTFQNIAQKIMDFYKVWSWV